MIPEKARMAMTTVSPARRGMFAGSNEGEMTLLKVGWRNSVVKDEKEPVIGGRDRSEDGENGSCGDGDGDVVGDTEGA